jgi:hypothetical protein
VIKIGDFLIIGLDALLIAEAFVSSATTLPARCTIAYLKAFLLSITG